ncbi:MAG: hypothetical protein ACRDK1_01945 [Solirubrobacterales bacterium]
MASTDELVERLRAIAARFGEPELESEEAEGLAREAADLVGKASAEMEAELRDLRAGAGS